MKGIIKKVFITIYYRGFFFPLGLSLDNIFRRIFFPTLSLKTYLKVKCFLRIGYLVNFYNPKTFNEKLINKKINKGLFYLSPYADKYGVREILKDKGFGFITNDLYCYFSKNKEISFDKLPNAFVMKANHGSGMIKIVKDKSRENPEVLLNLARKWLNSNYNKSVGGTDFHYDAIKPKIIFEKILENKDGSPLLDFKFYCFNGSVEFIDLVDNSKAIPIMFIYDKNWEQLPFSLYNKPIKGNFPKPGKLEEMVNIAEDLSKEFDFVRIDLYLIDNHKTIFGEYTFFPGGGMLKFFPKKFDKIYGEKLTLSKQ